MPGTIIFPVVGDSRISSGYGSRSSPGGIGSTNHRGVDIAAPIGTPVVAPTDMRISTAGWGGGYGNLVRGVDAQGNTYEFGHLSQIDVKPGDTIAAGTELGNVGSTGNSTGPHLHFGIKDAAGKFLDPSSLLNNAKKLATSTIRNVLGDKATDALGAVLSPNPIVGAIVGELTSDGEQCADIDYICKLRKWMKDSEFFPRLALVIVSVIFIAGAFVLLGKAQTGRVISMVQKVKGSS